MVDKGHCEQETQDKLKEYAKTLIELKNLERAMRSDRHLLAQILLEHAKRIDTQERRLILLEDRVYKGSPTPPCD